MDRDLAGFDEASDPGPLQDTNWAGHVARVPPARTGPRPTWTPGPADRREGAPLGRVAIPIAPPDAELPHHPPGADPHGADPHGVAQAGSGRSASTLVLVGAGIGAVTAAALGSVGVVAIVAALVVLAPGREGAAPAPVVVTAAPGAEGPSRAVVTRQVDPSAPAGTTSAPAGTPSAPERGWVRSTVDAVASFVAPAPAAPAAPTPRPAPHVVPVTGSPAAAAAVSPSDLGLEPSAGSPSAGVARSSGVAPVVVGSAGQPSTVAAPASEPAVGAVGGEVSVAGQVVVDRPGSASFGRAESAPVGAAPAPQQGWGDGSWSSVVQTVTSLVTGTAAPAPAAVGSAPVGSAGLGADDGMDELMASLGGDRTPPAPRADDPALAVLAELDAPTAPRAAAAAGAPAAPVGAGDDMDELLAALSTDPRVAPAPGAASPGASPSALGAGPAASGPAVAGAPVGGVGPDPMAALLADLEVDAPRGSSPTAIAGQPTTEGGSVPATAAGWGGAPAPAAGWGAAPAASATAPNAAPVAPAPSGSGGWFDTVVGVGSAVASYVIGDPADATFAPSAANPGGGAGLALDDDEVLRGPKPNAWETTTAAGDPSLAILAELDGPLPTRAGQPTMTARAPAAAAAPAGAPVAAAPGDLSADDDGTAALLAALGDDRDLPSAADVEAAAASWTPPVAGAPVAGGVAPAASAPAAASASGAAPAAAPAPAPSGSWFDTVVGVGSSVASLVTGGDAVFAPGAPAPAAGPGLALDDDETVRARTPGAWETPASAGDPTLAVLAELDGPLPTRPGQPTMGARAPTVSAPPTADELVADDPTADLIASIGADRPADPQATDGVAGGFVDTASAWAGTVAGVLLGESPAPVAGVAYAPPPSAPARPAVVAADAFFAPTSFAPVAGSAAAPQACAEGEWCDQDLTTWRDDGSAGNLLAEDDLELGMVQRTAEGELFALPSDADDVGAGEFDGLSTLLVHVTTDVPGIGVEIDGKALGSSPVVAELTPGVHTVRLSAGGGAVTTYRLSATRDPDEWCFELRGRALKNVTCR